MKILLRILVAGIAVTLIAAPVEAKPRAAKAQSDISAKYSQFHDGIAQNFK